MNAINAQALLWSHFATRKVTLEQERSLAQLTDPSLSVPDNTDMDHAILLGAFAFGDGVQSQIVNKVDSYLKSLDHTDPKKMGDPKEVPLWWKVRQVVCYCSF